MVRILGLDPGLASTGWGVLDADSSRFQPVAYGSIETDKSLSTGNRLKIIHEKCEELIRDFKPAIAGIESLFFAKNVTSAIPVAQARGVLLLVLAQNNISASEFTPQQIKQSLTGNGRADKTAVQEMVKMILGMEEIPQPDHAADALAAAVCGFNAYLMASRGVIA